MPRRTRNQSQDINQFDDVVRRSTQDPGPVDLTDRAAISQGMRAMGRRGGLKPVEIQETPLPESPKMAV